MKITTELLTTHAKCTKTDNLINEILVDVQATCKSCLTESGMGMTLMHLANVIEMLEKASLNVKKAKTALETAAAIEEEKNK